MARKPDDVQIPMQETYAELVVNGTPRQEAAIMAGYSPKTHVRDIERKDGPVHNLLTQKLRDKGLDEEWLADKLKSNYDMCLEDGAKDKAMMAAVQNLKEVANLLGYKKNDKPGVAIQINNNPGGNPGNEFVPTRELIEGLQTVIGLLEAENRRDRPIGVHASDVETRDAETRSGMGEPIDADETPGSGGQP